MILEIDMGNSRIKWRLRGDSGRLAAGAFSPGEQGYAGLLTELPLGSSVTRVWVASVLGGEINKRFSRWSQEALGLTPEFAVSKARYAGVTNSYANPEALGVDRWLAMLAAYNNWGGPCAVIQAGSALTVDLLDTEGRHLGGYIGPGLQMMRQSLWENTDRVRPTFERWASLGGGPGTDTEGAVQGALSAMALGLVERGLDDLNALSGGVRAILISGGDGPLLADQVHGAHLVPELVLDGLAPALGNC